MKSPEKKRDSHKNLAKFRASVVLEKDEKEQILPEIS